MSGELPGAFRLDGRVAVVTGAGSGIGRATAALLVEAGARVVAGDVNEAGLEETLADLPQDVALGVPTDVTDVDAVESLVSAAEERFGPLGVMVNVAGILSASPVLELEEAELDRILAVNLKGVIFGCQAAGRRMAPRGRGAIVNITSSAAFEPHPRLAAYSMSKAAVTKLTRVLALELARKGVRVNAVAPGMVDTPMAGRQLRASAAETDAERRAEMIESVRLQLPLATVGQPLDIALAVLYLASDASRYMTGQVIHLNGGRPMV